MKNVRYKYWLLLAMAIPLLVSSCVKEDDWHSDGAEKVPVSLSLEVAPLEDATPGTKAIIEPEVSAANQIKNILVLQFDGITGGARMIGEQEYFDHWPLHPGESLTLIASSTPNTVIVLANTFDRVPINPGTTLSLFKENGFSTILDLSDVCTTDNGNQYLRMSASTVLSSITSSTALTVILKRNVAKIVVNITNATSGKTGDDRVTISNLQLCNIPDRFHYLAHISSDLTDEDPALAFTDGYSNSSQRFMDQQEFPAAGNGGSPQTFTFYVPASVRNTTTNTAQFSKDSGAPAGATFLRLVGSYGDRNTPIYYTYYLGANLTDDFNLLPNCKYTYDISIGAKGDDHFDYRIEDMKETVFEKDANCYMLHPPKVDGLTRDYSFPVRRAAVFWNQDGVNNGVYGGSTLTGFTSYWMDGSTQWTAEVLWSDFPLSSFTGDKAFLQTVSGRGFAPGHEQPYIKVRVSSGMKGNVVVAMKVNGVILWSWHLWITDYDPDRHVVPQVGQYIYGVGSGEIHRYNNTLWSTPATENTVGYAAGFAMDRNLGASGRSFSDPGSRGCFYQYGRKDPFLDRNQYNLDNHFYLGGTTDAIILIYSSEDNRIFYNETGASGNKNIRYAVAHPMTFIVADSYNYWTAIDDDLGDGGVTGGASVEYQWNDRKFKVHNGDQDILELKKSIYDPCPPCWKVPIDGTWDGFDTNTVWDAIDRGYYYYPEGYVNKSIFFPLTGQRTTSTGTFSNLADYGFYWSSSPANSTYTTMAQIFYITSGLVKPSSGYWRANGFVVRCVKE